MVMPYRFCAAFAFCLIFISAQAHAQAEPGSVPGCKPKVMRAMQAKAEAKVAYDVAVTQQFVKKPDSVLATTCFNKSAKNSADKGGAIFSDVPPPGAVEWTGPLETGLPTIIEDSLNTMYENFDGAEGHEGINSDLYSPSASSLDVTGVDCDGIKNLWSRVEDGGVTGGVPYVTFNDLENGTVPGGTAAAGDDFMNNFAASTESGVFSNLGSSMAAIQPPAAPSFTGNQSSCEVLRTAGIVPNCP
jgi:hypothetical protein